MSCCTVVPVPVVVFVVHTEPWWNRACAVCCFLSPACTEQALDRCGECFLYPEEMNSLWNGDISLRSLLMILVNNKMGRSLQGATSEKTMTQWGSFMAML
jgi:hypothetical protein